MLRSDLAKAGIPYQDDEGRFLDFRSLRHTFGTNLARAGVSPTLAQELMRHSDINLTMGIYSHSDLPDMAAAVERLPAFPTMERNELRATGTEGLVALRTGNLGSSLGLSQETEEQISSPSPEPPDHCKPLLEHGDTRFSSAHEKRAIGET